MIGRASLLFDFLDYELEATVVEWFARRALLRYQSLALLHTLHFERAMVAVGVVARFAEEGESRPGTSRSACLGIVARPADTPEIIDGTVSRLAKRRGSLPDVFQALVSDVSAGPVGGRQRRAPFDRAVRL